MKVLLFAPKGFETCEFGVFIDVFGWARETFGYDIHVVTCGFTKTVTSAFGLSVTVDRLIDEIDTDDYAALAIPGGREVCGFFEDAYHERFLDMIREFEAKGKIIATICVAALPVAKSGVLQNRKGTTYSLDDGTTHRQLSGFGVDVEDTRIVVDGRILTSHCPETAFDVAFKLLEMLTTEKDAEKVKHSMGF